MPAYILLNSRMKPTVQTMNKFLAYALYRYEDMRELYSMAFYYVYQ